MIALDFSALRLDKLPTDTSLLYRVWCPPGSDWEPNPHAGAGRADCPVSPREYSILYTGTSALIAVQETYVLTSMGHAGGWVFHQGRAEEMIITTYRTRVPLAAISLDKPNASLLGLDDVTLLDGEEPYRAAVLAVWRSRRADAHAVCWRSKHREANGLVVALFHESKTAAGLQPIDRMKLVDHPIVEAIRRSKVVVVK